MIIYIIIVTLLFVLGWIIYCNVKKNKPNNPYEKIVSESRTSILEKTQINEQKSCNINIKEDAIEEKNENPNDEKIDNTLPEGNINEIDNCNERTSSAIITTGENDYYKELLQDSRWISLRDSIKRRDDYTCQDCYNTIKINHLEELKDMNLPINQEVLDYIITSFPKLKDMFRDDNTEEEEEIDFETKSCYISRYKLYRYTIYSIFRLGVINGIEYEYPFPPILSSLDPSEVLSGYIKRKDFNNDITGQKLTTRCFYLKGNSTQGKIYITYFYGSIGQPRDKHYLAVITLDEYSIVFPLTGIFLKLEVHHLKYSKTRKPWDVSKDNLITLCHSCHIEAHKEAKKRPISIE